MVVLYSIISHFALYMTLTCYIIYCVLNIRIDVPCVHIDILYIYIYIYMYVDVYYIYIYVHLLLLYVHIHIYIYIYISVCVCVTNTCMCKRTCQRYVESHPSRCECHSSSNTFFFSQMNRLTAKQVTL